MPKMSRIPPPPEFEQLSPHERPRDGPDFPTWRRKPTNEVMAMYKIQELRGLVMMHRRDQRMFDPLAHCQYWLRELCIHDCERKLAHAQIDLRHCVVQQQVKNSLDTVESYLKGVDVIDSSVRRITSVLLEKASADMQATGPPWEKEELERKRPDFQNLLRQSYNVKTSLGWCSVTRSFGPHSVMRPTHIFPYWVGGHIMKSIFGPRHVDDTLTANNGLVVHESVATALANLWIVIVPAGAPQSGRWKTRVVEKDLLNKYLGSCDRTWQTVDNQELKFQGHHRPSARYLYWHYATTQIHASARQPANFWTDLMGKDCWKPDQVFLRLDYLDAYLDVRQVFALENFANLRQHANAGWWPRSFLDVRIAARWVSNLIDTTQEVALWHELESPADEQNGYGVNEEDFELSPKQVNGSGCPVHLIGPKVNASRPESPHGGPPGLELFSSRSEGEREDKRCDSNTGAESDDWF